jgi:organic radical activating enzyme
MNHQPSSSPLLPVMESFYTIQGEGINAGRAAYFIRLGGCDVGCVWCDVKESWDAANHEQKSIDQLVEEASAQPSRFVVITGGEPLMYDLQPLTDALHAAGFEIALETSGAYPLSGTWDWICVSPKKFKPALASVIAKAQEFKVVVYHRQDLEWMETLVGSVNDDCALLLQPEYSKFDTIVPVIVQYVKDNPRYRISLQSHKVMLVP